MALTAAQVVKIRRYLGVGFNYSGGLDHVDIVLAALTAAQEAEILEIVEQIEAIDAKLASTATSGAGIIQVEEIRWDASATLSVTRSERARLVDELRSLLGVSVQSGRGNGPTMRG